MPFLAWGGHLCSFFTDSPSLPGPPFFVNAFPPNLNLLAQFAMIRNMKGLKKVKMKLNGRLGKKRCIRMVAKVEKKQQMVRRKATMQKMVRRKQQWRRSRRW